MNHRFVVFSIGKLLQILGLILLVPAAIAWFGTTGTLVERVFSPSLSGFLIAIVISVLTGTLLVISFSKDKGRIDVKEGFAIVTFGWITLAFAGSIPLFTYFLSSLDSFTFATVTTAFTDAFFEVMSGLTTTGATILTNVEALPAGLLFWRSLTHWIGGMGIVTLAMALFPAFGVSAYQLFRGEVPGPTKDRLKPRLAQTATILWGVYALLTLIQTILLLFGKMSLFDALCHSFGTMATGGFSTRNLSIAAFNSAYIEWVILIFMFLAGTNFLIHYKLIFGRDISMIKENREFHFYLSTIIVITIMTVSILAIQGILPDKEIECQFRAEKLTENQIDQIVITETNRIRTPSSLIRESLFQVVSILTTTGFTTADWDKWPDAIRITFMVLMFFGGSAGSTAGGLKMIRILVLFKIALHQSRIMIQPRLVSPVKIGKHALSDSQMWGIVSFFIIFMVLFVFFSILMATMIPNFATAVSSVAATLGNIGPGLSGVGAFETYAWIPVPGKWILITCMLLGRLEIYTVLIAFSRISWKK